jgi:hypothetical protein
MRNKALGYKPLAVNKTISNAGLRWLAPLIMGFTVLSVQADVILEEFVEPKPNAIEKFDHLSTGFPLTGDHDLLECKQCHTAGFYEKLPTRCDACHNNATAQGIPANHVKVTGPCDICHTTTGFIENLVMDHRFVQGACFTCHNSNSLKGKPANHVAASNLCDACHNTTQWTPVEQIEHSQLQAPCRICHDGIKAVGKSPTHIASSDQCTACHQTSGAWLPVTTDHEQVRGSCSGCHALPQGHQRTSSLCGDCHFSRLAWRDKVSVNHDAVRDACYTCHFPPNNHLAGLERCDDCHSVRSFKEIRVRHTKFRSKACERCHNGLFAVNKPQKHCRTSRRCEECHRTHDWDNDKKC